MGSSIAFVVAGLALASALASWIAAAVFCARAVEHRRCVDFLTCLIWPFRRVEGTSQVQSINKALVAFIAALMVAAAAISVATNLSRVAR